MKRFAMTQSAILQMTCWQIKCTTTANA